MWSDVGGCRGDLVEPYQSIGRATYIGRVQLADEEREDLWL